MLRIRNRAAACEVRMRAHASECECCGPSRGEAAARTTLKSRKKTADKILPAVFHINQFDNQRAEQSQLNADFIRSTYSASCAAAIAAAASQFSASAILRYVAADNSARSSDLESINNR